MEKIYNCNTCSEAFSSRRVLGGHVRSHMAAAGLAARNVKLPVFTEKSESDSCLTHRANDDGRGRDLGKSPRNSVESFVTGKKKIGSWSSENHCGVCQKGFGSRRALFGHMWVHSSSKRRRKVQSDCVASPVVQVSSVEVATNVRKSSLEEALSLCEIACPTTRRKRSVRVKCSGNEPGKDVIHEMGIPLSALLSSGIREDEIEAVTGLLMISTGVGSWKYSDVGKNSSRFLQTGNEGQVLDDFLLGVGNKRRRLGEVNDDAAEMLKVPGCADSLSINSNVKGKVMEYQITCDMISGEVEVRSFGRGGIVEEMRSLVVDVLEGEKIPELRSDDEVGGGNKKRMLPDSDCTKSALTFQRRGYKCKSCRRIFTTQLKLGDHRVTSCCSSTEDKKVNGECTSSPSHANGPEIGLSFDGHDSEESEVAASERDCHGTLLPDLSVPVEVSSKRTRLGLPSFLVNPPVKY